jgi:hypothetical protein
LYDRFVLYPLDSDLGVEMRYGHELYKYGSCRIRIAACIHDRRATMTSSDVVVLKIKIISVIRPLSFQA